jgi:long-chain acyl-CoA synthetase
MDTRPWHQAYDTGVPAGLDLEAVPLPGFLARSATRYPDATAILFLGARLTYRELQDEVDRFAAGLATLGVEPGTRVAIHLPNMPQTVIAYYAVLSLGAVAVMTNPLYVEREIEHQWNDAGCTVAVTTDALFAARLHGIRDALPVAYYVLASIPEYLPQPQRLVTWLALRVRRPPQVARVPVGPGLHRFRALAATASLPPRPSIAMDDLAVLQYTGGTTGTPKGAMLSHGNLSSNVQQIVAWFVDTQPGGEVMLGCLPFFHVFGMTVAMNFAVVTAAANVLIPDPRDIPRVVRAIARHRVTVFPGVPQMFAAVADAGGDDAQLDLTSVKACFSGGAPLPRAVLERFESITGSKLVEGYGLTEASPVTHANPVHGVRKTGSIGVPCPDTDMRVVSLDDSRTPVAAGEEGELLVRGPQVMQGYWGRPDETATAVVDGWLHTGDVVRVDENGYSVVVGRKKDLIIAGGYNIYPAEVDDALMRHPAVADAATIGVPDERRGETVKAFVVLRAGARATADDLEAHCRRELAAYKVPRAFEFLDALPRSSVQKVLRRELRKREETR